MRKKFAQGLPAIALALGLAIAVTGCDNGAGAGAGTTMNPALIGVWVGHDGGWHIRMTISDGNIVMERREGIGPWVAAQRITFTAANGMIIMRLAYLSNPETGEWMDRNATLQFLIALASEDGYPLPPEIMQEIVAETDHMWNQTMIWSYTVAGNNLILTQYGFPPMHLVRQ